MTIDLLLTKLHIPLVRASLVSRPRLIKALALGWNQGRKLTLVSAPAGYGKTTLIADWLRLAAAKTAWLSLDESDNDPTRFLSYLVAALERVSEHLGDDSRAMLQAPQPPPFEAILTALLNEIATLAPPFILVLDDYHTIHTPTIHQQVSFLLEHQPTQLHLVILTREDPPLPLSRLRAGGQMVEIREDDLRFSLEECTEFLQRLMALDLSNESVSALERRTEGWIAGLQLAALSLQGRPDAEAFIRAFTGSSRFVMDYLIDEVFWRQSADVQGFLLQTSILDRLSGPLCDTVMGRSGSQKVLEALEQANLFIFPLDPTRQWYRYHRLFAELLRHRLQLQEGHPEVLLHQRASQWLEEHGYVADAIHHATAAGDWERAGTLIQRHHTGYLKRGEVLTVIGWFQSLPEKILLSNPKLCFEYCWPLLLASQYDLAAPLLEGVEQAAQDIPAFLGEVYAAQAYLARGVGNHERMVERSQQALDLLPKSSVNSRGIVALNLGLAYWHMGQMRDAELVLAEALEAAQGTGNHYAALTALIFIGRVLAVRGQLHQAVEYFNSAIHQGKEIPVNALAYMDLAAVHYEWNALDVSDAYLQKAIALCRRSKNDEFLAGCWILVSRLRIAQSDLAGAEGAVEQARELVRAGKVSAQMAERVNAAQAHLLMERGASAGEWGQVLTDKVDCHPFYRFLGVIKARTLPNDQAMAYLEMLSQVAQANEWGYGLVAIRALQASFAQSQDKAVEYLTEALQLSENGGFIRSFVEVGKGLIPHLQEAARGGICPEHVGRILTVMTGKLDTDGARSTALIEPLSGRELEVLRLVIMGMSNREIADRLIISIGTAKTHVHNLCGKLGVRNRTEAAMKAKDLGLV